MQNWTILYFKKIEYLDIEIFDFCEVDRRSDLNLFREFNSLNSDSEYTTQSVMDSAEIKYSIKEIILHIDI